MDLKNNMICDIETGVCGPGGNSEMQFIDLSVPQKEEKVVEAFVCEQLDNDEYETKEVLGGK